MTLHRILSLFARIRAALARPFPFVGESPASATRAALGFGAFVAVFLVFFPPIGFGEIPAPAFYWHAAAYGGICFAGMMLNLLALPRLSPRVFTEEGWTIGRHIALSLWNVVLIASGNLAYTVWQFHVQLSVHAAALFLLVTFLVGIFPVAILTLLKERRLMRRHLENTSRLSEQIHARAATESSDRQEPRRQALVDGQRQTNAGAEAATATVVFEGASAQERFETRVGDILCLQANDNYVTIFALNAEGGVQKALLRMTLKYAAARLQGYPFAARCHKSYIINLRRVEDITGNAQGYKLFAPPLDFSVPVSRSYHSEILRQLREYREDDEAARE